MRPEATAPRTYPCIDLLFLNGHLACRMKHLPVIQATPEQLPLISGTKFGYEVIRGAAGSGKTSTAILRLQSLGFTFEQRRKREESDDPIRILVLTFNKTLRGYVNQLVTAQTSSFANAVVEIETYAKWARDALGRPTMVEGNEAESKIKALAATITPLAPSFVAREVDYLLGRFPANLLEQYLTKERTGRGSLPRVERSLRLRILKEVVEPYQQWLLSKNAWDWNDLAIAMERAKNIPKYDVIIVDETQDFSANQIRSLHPHLATPFAATFVIDSVQRLYARGFSWAEAGLPPDTQYHILRENHRNTAEIAAFAAGILTGLPADSDGATPDLTRTSRSGTKPVVLKGIYPQQLNWVIDFIRDKVNLRTESVVFLSPGGWFELAKDRLNKEGIGYVEITRKSEWPDGDENVAFSTFHSAKGLEFDHVFILGLSNENTAHGDDAVDDQLTTLRRLLAVAIGRARETVCIGYKPGEESDLVQFFDPATYDAISV